MFTNKKLIFLITLLLFANCYTGRTLNFGWIQSKPNLSSSSNLFTQKSSGWHIPLKTTLAEI